MYKLPVILILFSALTCHAQIPEDFLVFGKADLPEAKFKPSRYFTGESLFGYMNGGAELYREYGISGAVITEFEVDNRYYKCEVFRMNGPEEAFGIYSVSKFKCRGSSDIAPWTCLNKYQLQLCKGNYYISIINRSGTSADSLVAVKTAKLLEGKINDPSFDLKTFLPDMDIDTEDIRGIAVLVKGKLGLANGATDWEDYFRDQPGYTALISEAEDKTILSVRFSNQENIRLFSTLHGWDSDQIGINDVILSSGETIRLLGDNHLLVRIGKTAAVR